MQFRQTAAVVGTFIAGTLALGLVAKNSSATIDQNADPRIAAQPRYDYDDPSKSFVVDLDFGATSATTVGATVVPQRSYSHLGDPPLLLISLKNSKGAVLTTFNSWDPRWTFDETPSHGERMIMRPGRGTVVASFNGAAATMLVRDQQSGTDLGTVDLRPAVHSFCVAHPDDAECVEADLAVTSTQASAPPLGLVGKGVTVTVDATVANLGPDGPVDAVVNQTVTASAGTTVTPASATNDVHALAKGSSSTVRNSYSVSCDTPGQKTVTFTTSVAPAEANVVDAVATNNSKSTTVSIDCAVPITLNVKPGSARNPVSLNEQAIPMAALTTRAGEYGNPLAFDAALIDPASVRIGTRDSVVAGRGVPEVHGKVHMEDSLEMDETTHDGDLDGVLHADGRRIPVQRSTTELCVRGTFGQTHTTFFGCDHIEVVP